MGGDGKWWQVNFWKSGTRSSWNAWNLWPHKLHSSPATFCELFGSSLPSPWWLLHALDLKRRLFKGLYQKTATHQTHQIDLHLAPGLISKTVLARFDKPTIVPSWSEWNQFNLIADDKFEFTLFTLLTSSRHLLTSLHTFLYQRTPSFKTQRNQAGEKLCKLESPWISYK